MQALSTKKNRIGIVGVLAAALKGCVGLRSAFKGPNIGPASNWSDQRDQVLGLHHHQASYL